MPSLKDLNCSIELPQSKQILREFGTAYSDGVVETFVAVPSEPSKFAIHLTSSTYIADGLAMYVYIDGVYQCNRNRMDMKERAVKGKPVEFLVRQKEEKQKDGRIIAREWTFGKLNIVSVDQAPQQCSPNVVDNIGCIEVIVLRCKGFRIPGASKSNMGFDGSYDSPDDYFGMDGRPQSWGFDDRTFVRPHIHDRARTQDQLINGKRKPLASRPPPPFSRRSYSPGAASRSGGHVIIPEGAYQYGSGPVLRKSRAEPDTELFADRTARNIAGHDIVNPEWLKRIREEAYHRGLREAELKKLREELGRHHHGLQCLPENGPPPRPPAYEHAGAPPVNANPEYLQSHQAGTPRNPWGLATNQAWDKHQSWPGEDKTGGWHGAMAHGNDSSSWATSAWESDSVSLPPLSHASRPKPVASTTYKCDRKSKMSYHPPSFGGAPTIQTTPESPTWGGGENETWDTATSVWSTESTIISPREHISRAQAGRSQKNMASLSDTWTSPPSRGHVKPPLNVPTAKYSSQCFNIPSQLPPIPVPLDFRHRTNVRPHSPPPPYPALPVHLFRTASKTSVVTSELPSAAQKRTKSGKPAWPWGMATPVGTHAQPPGAGSVSKQKTAPSHASSVWTTSEGPPDTKRDESKGWDTGNVLMPGSWNDGEESKEKPNPDDGWGKDRNFASAGQTKSSDGWEQGGDKPSKNVTTEKTQNNSGWNNDNNEPTWNQSNNNAETPAWNQSCAVDKKSDWNNDNNRNEDDAKASEKAWNADDNTKQDETTGDAGWANNGWGGFPTADNDIPKGENGPAGSANAENKDDGWGGFPPADNDTPKGEGGVAGWANTDSKYDAQKNDTSGDANEEWQNNEQNNDATQPTWENTDNNAAATQENLFADQGRGNGANDWNIPQANQDPASAKHSTSTARKSRSRHHRRAPSQIGPKSYWAFPPPAPSTAMGMRKLYPIPEDQESTLPGSIAKGCVLPPEPLPPIPEDKAKENGLSHQVQPGEGMRYTHAVGRPEYLDGFERPYAVFRFKYRSRKELKRLFGEEVPDEEKGLVVQSEDGKEKEKQEKEKLKVLSEEEKVEEILRLKKMLEEKGNAGDKKEQDGEANNFLENWVNDQRERSRKSSRKTESKKSASNKGKEANWGGEWGEAQAGSKKSASNKGGEVNWGGGWGEDQAGSKKAASQQAEWNKGSGSKKSASKASQKAESKKGDNAGVTGEVAWDSGNGGGGEASWKQDDAGADGGDWNNKADAGEPAGVSW